ncbi:MAG: gliding motility-associated transport system ATP-binding protein [Acidobacteriota bacterium]|jgi:ABC-2 type transport system ATP-binding protein|nr:gliding motility-associated transport system ATP-binding protein [Acidobacteriota bacterium]
MIEAQNLSRRYGDFTAVDDVSFAVDDGEILGMLGPNGAGKTTTIRMITGFLPPTRGRVTVFGKDLFDAPRDARREIGYLPENVALYPEMRVEEYLAYRARLEGLAGGAVRQAIGEAVERCLLSEVRGQIIGTLSKGYRQRVGLATAILHKPRVLVLDEPTVGLDPKQIIAIRELIRELGQKRTLLLSTHILPEVELLCNRVLIIDRGKIVAQGTPQDLRERWVGNPTLRVTIKGEPAGAAEVLAAIPGVLAVRPGAEPGAWVIESERAVNSIDIREEVFRAAVERSWVLLELAAQKASLEDIFVRLTTRDLVAAPAAATPGNGEDGEVAA